MQFQWLFYLGKMENKKWQITLIYITDNIKKTNKAIWIKYNHIW